LKDGYATSNDGKLVIGFVQAIHAAEKRQAGIDAHAFNEEKKALKVNFLSNLSELAEHLLFPFWLLTSL
jgi:mitofilin